MFPCHMPKVELRYVTATVIMDPFPSCILCYACMSVERKSKLKMFFMLWKGSSNFVVAPRKNFGAPISRRRLFIFLLRRDVMTAECLSEDFTTVLSSKLTDLLLAFSKEKVPQWFLDPTISKPLIFGNVKHVPHCFGNVEYSIQSLGRFTDGCSRALTPSAFHCSARNSVARSKLSNALRVTLTTISSPALPLNW